MHRLLRIVLLAGLILGGVAACDRPGQVEPTQVPSTPITGVAESPILPTAVPTLPPLTPEAGYGGAKGIVEAFPSAWAGNRLYVYFAPFRSTEAPDEGFFVLEPSIHPSTDVDPAGAFQLGNIPPDKYVVVIGPSPEKALAIREGDRPQIFEVLEGEILDLGKIRLE